MSSSENKSQFQEILDGYPPSDILNLILEKNDDLSKHDLAVMFLHEFDLLDSEILPIIWHWKSTKSMRGMDDSQFNKLILNALTQAGYKILNKL